MQLNVAKQIDYSYILPFSIFLYKTSGVCLPKEYRCIIDNAKLRADFVEEALADMEDILYDFK